MKRRRTLVLLSCAVAVLVIGGLIWWNISRPITNIAPSSVSKIDVFDGRTGQSTTISNRKDIQHIMENLDSVHLKKQKISLGYMGFYLRTTIYNVHGRVSERLIIESSTVIRKDPFFYDATSKQVDSGYIQRLLNK